jgi:natural product biosynthesis luciferase-like monooxygenase protein
MSHGPLDGADLASSAQRPLSAVLVGADSLLCECGDRLLGKGFHIAAIVTGAARVRDWAEARGLAVLATGSDWIGELAGGEGFDHLFAITHLALLPDAALALPRAGAFNFHDAPLPDYAGLHCPVWALIDGRQEHGVSWHRITSGIDEGDLVATRRFAIDADETSLTLNTKCFEAGLDSFDELADALLTGTLAARAQDERPGRLCRGDERPAAACALDRTRGADELERLVRALDFGPYPAPIGSPWLSTESGPIWVTRARAVDAVAGATPGTVVAVDGDEVTLACGTGALAISGLRRACGSPVLPNECGLVAGRALQSPPERVLGRLTTTHRVTTRFEAAWARELARTAPADLSFGSGSASASVGSSDIVVDLPRAFVERFGQDACAIAALAGAWFARTSSTTRQTFAYRAARQAELARGCDGLFSSNVPFTVEYDGTRSFAEQLDDVRTTAMRTARRGTYLVDTVARRPELSGRGDLAGRLALPVGIVAVDSDDGANCGTRATFRVETGGLVTLRHERSALDNESAHAFVEALVDFAGEIARRGDVALDEVELVGEQRRAALLDTHHAVELDRTATIASQFEAAVSRFGDEPALSFERTTLTYSELDARVTTLAARLVEEGVSSDRLVGVHLERSLDLVVAVLAVGRAGGAYLPLDPGYPTDRLDLMLSDSGAGLVLTEGWNGACPEGVGTLDPRDVANTSMRRPSFASPAPTDLAYCIYTSGSTGRPKGVQVEHRNAVNFFAGMDERIGTDARGTWLAVTSLSFDISVLELLWTLTRGFHVVVYRERQRDLAHARTQAAATPRVPDRNLDFSMFLWGNDDGEGPDKYALTMGAAEFADQNGFTAIWTPERHFHAFGGPFPNPSVISAAIAARTETIQIRAGSCVVPLHHPLRIAEEWAVVDHLSNGRVGMAAASGWQPDDFVLAPQNFEKRGELLFEFVDQLQRLWRGEEVEFENPFGERIPRLSLPRPVQSELPLWITSAGNPETYRRAGAMGANVLTHLLGQSVEEVAEKIAIYRAARTEAGLDPAGGTVTLMLHAFVGESEEAVRATVRGPLKSYLDASIGLVKKYAWSFPAFKPTAGSTDVDLTSLSDEERDAILEHAFDRYFTTSGLFGTVEQCVARVAEVCAIGVDEVACLVDYGVERATMMASFERLAEVFRATRVGGASTNAAAASLAEHTLPALIERHAVTHLQCTPSMARMLATDPASRASLGRLRHLMVGGEALSADLASELVQIGPDRVTNMYGPTETTIWSSTWDVPGDMGREDEVSIGDPIANTSLFVLDERMRPVPAGVPGELWIGGEGVVRGYLGRDDLTAERFVDSPFGTGRIYRTGDLAAWRGDGRLRFLGRNDHQVKIRGYRIELGEIEARLRAGIGVHDAVAVAREDTPGDVRLVAYVAPTKPGVVSTDALRTVLESCLPAYMVPSAICELPSLPLTPNGKVDRNALPRPEELLARTRPEPVAPEGDVERRLAETFARTLGLESVGRDDNFFELGGHSLLVVQLHRELVSDLAPTLSLTDLYRFPTVAGLAGLVGGEASGGPRALADGSTRGAARGAARRELMRRRRNAS